MSTRFAGTDDEVHFPITDDNDVVGAFTVAMIERRRGGVGTSRCRMAWHVTTENVVDPATQGVSYMRWMHDSSNQGQYGTQAEGSSSRIDTYGALGTIMDSTTDWCVSVITRAAGSSVVPRSHLKNLTQATAGTHRNMSSAIPAPRSHAGGYLCIGEFRNIEDLDSNVARTAIWRGIAFTDAQVEALFADLKTTSWLLRSGAVPVHLVDYNVLRNGVYRDYGSGAQDSSLIQGASIDTATDPPGIVYDGGGSPQTFTVPAIPSGQAFGAANVVKGVRRAPLPPIPSAQGFGALTVERGARAVGLPGIPSGQEMGSFLLLGQAGIALPPVPSGQAFGALTVERQPMAIGVPSIPSAGAVPDLTITPGDAVVEMPGIASGQGFGTLGLTRALIDTNQPTGVLASGRDSNVLVAARPDTQVVSRAHETDPTPI